MESLTLMHGTALWTVQFLHCTMQLFQIGIWTFYLVLDKLCTFLMFSGPMGQLASWHKCVFSLLHTVTRVLRLGILHWIYGAFTSSRPPNIFGAAQNLTVTIYHRLSWKHYKKSMLSHHDMPQYLIIRCQQTARDSEAKSYIEIISPNIYTTIRQAYIFFLLIRLLVHRAIEREFSTALLVQQQIFTYYQSKNICLTL